MHAGADKLGGFVASFRNDLGALDRSFPATELHDNTHEPKSACFSHVNSTMWGTFIQAGLHKYLVYEGATNVGRCLLIAATSRKGEFFRYFRLQRSLTSPTAHMLICSHIRKSKLRWSFGCSLQHPGNNSDWDYACSRSEPFRSSLKA